MISQTACTGSGSDSSASASSAPSPAINPSDQLAATAEVATFFKSCALQTGPIGTGDCPQRINPSDICYPFTNTCQVETPFNWTLVGDPSSQLSFSVDASGRLQAVGHYLMVVSYCILPYVCHDVSGGPFMAILQRNGTAFSLEGLTSGQGVRARGLSDTGDHAAILSSVKAFFAACATATTSDGTPDCPQSINGGCVTEGPAPVATVWTLKGDPTARATVTWDPDIGIYSVNGTEDFHAETTGPCNGRFISEDYGGLYWATVILSHDQPEVINIGGLNNSGCPFC